jgi:hypothetical protein
MAFTTPGTAVAGEVLTAAFWNTNVRDNLNSVGLVHLTTQSFSGATSASPVSLPANTFSDTYMNYRFTVNITASTTGGQLRLRLRASGTDNSSSNYTYGGYISYSGSSILSARPSNGVTTFFDLGDFSPTDYPNMSLIGDIMQPKAAFRTMFYANINLPVSPQAYFGNIGGAMSVTTSYDSFSIVPSAGSITGDVRVYGLRAS